MNQGVYSIEKIISTVDLHTAGEPVRLILGGVRSIPGKTMEEKQKFFSRELDYVRTKLLYEPRGHHEMCGTLLTPPVSQGSHFGLIFFDVGGYLDKREPISHVIVRFSNLL